MAAEVLKLELGEIEELSLKFADGLDVDGRYGPQVMFTVQRANGEVRSLYVPPVVAENIEGLRLGPHERFEIVKRPKNEGRKKGVEYVVSRVDPPMDRRNGPDPARTAIQAPVPARVPVSVPLASPGRNEQPQQHQENPNHQSSASGIADFITYNTTVLTGVLCASFDALRNCERYAESKGTKLEFNEEDVRNLGVTLFIQGSKGGAQQWR